MLVDSLDRLKIGSGEAAEAQEEAATGDATGTYAMAAMGVV